MTDMEAVQQQAPQAYPIPQFGHTSEGALLIHLDMEETILQIDRLLRCQVQWVNPETGITELVRLEGVEPQINDVGANKVLFVLRSKLNKVFSLTDLEDEEIAHMTITIGTIIREDFVTNWERYEIKDDTSASFILHTVCDIVFAQLRKSRDANYLQFLQKTHQIQEVQHFQSNNRNTAKPGMLSELKDRILRR